MTTEQLQALNRLPQFYTIRDLVDHVFGGDHDAFVDAWASRELPWSVRRACEESATPEQQQVWLLQRILAVQLEIRDRLAEVP